MSLLSQAYAATAESELLRAMRAASKHVTVAQTFGISRDPFNFLDKVRAYFRSVYRLSDNVLLRIMLQSWVGN